MPPEASLYYHQQPSLNMDNASAMAAFEAPTNGGDLPVKRRGSLRRLFPARHNSGSSLASSMTSSSTTTAASTPQSPTMRGPPVTYTGRYSPYRQESQYSLRKESSDSYRSLQSPTGPGPTPFLGANIRPPLSEAARQRTMNNITSNPHPASPARSTFGDLPPPPTANFSRPRKPSLKGNDDPRPGPGLQTSNTISPQPGHYAPLLSSYNSRPSLHERGASTSSTVSNAFIPIRTMKNSMSIPDLTGGRDPPLIGPAPPRKAHTQAASGLNTGDTSNHDREPLGKPNPLGDEVRDSQLSSQTTGTYATESTWNSTTSVAAWTAPSSFLGTDRSSIRSKASSMNSLAGREALEDLLGMYEDGFESGVESESDKPHPETLRALMAQDKEDSDMSTVPEPVQKEVLSAPPVLAINTTNMTNTAEIRDSAEMFSPVA